MLQHGDEHGGDAVEAGDALVRDAGERRLRREVRQREQRTPVRHRGCHGEHHTEAVEHGHLQHHAVRRGKVHAVANTLAVIHDVVMREHDALWEAGRAGGILHVADVVHTDGSRHAVDLLHRDAPGTRDGLLPGEASLLPEADRDDIAQKGQALCVQWAAGARRLQLRAQFGEDGRIVGIAVSVNQDQRVRVRLPEQVFRLVDLIGRVDRDEDGADLGGRPKGDVPLWQIGRPDGDMIARADAQRDERRCRHRRGIPHRCEYSPSSCI